MAGEIGAFGGLGSLVAHLGLDTRPLEVGLARARAEFRGLETTTASTFGSMSSVGTAAVAGLVAGFGILAVAGIHAADEFEKSHARLEGALSNVGASFEQYRGQIDATNDRMEKLGFTHAQTEAALSTLTRAAKDPAQAIAGIGLAADIARGRNIDLATASNLLSKALLGQPRALRALNIDTKDAAGNTIDLREAVKRLTETYGGQAQASAETFAGKIERLKATFTDLEVTVGTAVIPVLEHAGGTIADTIGFFERNEVAAKTLAVTLGALLVPAFARLATTQVVGALTGIGSVLVSIGSQFTQAGAGASFMGASLKGMAAGAAAVTAVGLLAWLMQIRSGANDTAAAIQNLSNVTNDQLLASFDDIVGKQQKKGGGKGGGFFDNLFSDDPLASVTGFHKQPSADAADKAFRDIAGSSEINGQRIIEAMDRAGRSTDGFRRILREIHLAHKQAQGSSAKDAGAVDEFGNTVKAADAAAEKYAETLLSLPKAQEAATKAHGDLADAQKKLSDLQSAGAVDAKAVADAQHQVEQSAHSMEAAQRGVGDAQDRLNQLLAQGPVDAKAVADAQDRVLHASESLTDAQGRLADAQDHLNEVMRGSSAEDLGKGELSLKQATLGLAQAKQAVADAQERLVEAYKSGDPNKIADASNNLKSAQLGVESAQFGLQDAQQKLNDLQNAGKAGSKDLAEAQSALAAAQRGVRDATKANADAQDALNRAQAGDPDYSRNVAAARQAVADAEWNARQATDDHAAAEANLRTARAGDPDFELRLQAAKDAVKTATYGVIDADVALMALQDELNGHADGFRDKLKLTADQLRATADMVEGSDPALANKLRKLADQLDVHYEFKLDTEAAQRGLDQIGSKYRDTLQQIKSDTGNILGPGAASPEGLQGILSLGVGHSANAGPFPAGWRVFGERGPELAYIPQPGFAFDAHKSAAMLDAAYDKMRQISLPPTATTWETSPLGRDTGNRIVHETHEKHDHFTILANGRDYREQAKEFVEELSWRRR